LFINIEKEYKIMSKPFPTTLTASRIALRILVVLNWVFGAMILAILTAMLTNEHWTMSALGVPPSPDTEALIQGMRAIAVIGLFGIPLNYLILSRLRDIVETVRAGDPFVAENANRLQTIAWVLLGVQVLGAVIGAIAKSVSTHEHPLLIDAFSTSGWLAVLLLFVLARVFTEGTRMRDDLEGTV
jgi:hypothetical protein